MSEKLYDKYTEPIQKRYKLTPIDLVQIEMEGLKNKWPENDVEVAVAFNWLKLPLIIRELGLT